MWHQLDAHIDHIYYMHLHAIDEAAPSRDLCFLCDNVRRESIDSCNTWVDDRYWNLLMSDDDDVYLTCQTLVCIKKTVMRHESGEWNRSDRNCKATRTRRKRKEREKRKESCIHGGRRQRPMMNPCNTSVDHRFVLGERRWFVLYRKTAARHKRGEWNRSYRNLKATKQIQKETRR